MDSQYNLGHASLVRADLVDIWDSAIRTFDAAPPGTDLKLRTSASIRTFDGDKFEDSIEPNALEDFLKNPLVREDLVQSVSMTFDAKYTTHRETPASGSLSWELGIFDPSTSQKLVVDFDANRGVSVSINGTASWIQRVHGAVSPLVSKRRYSRNSKVVTAAATPGLLALLGGAILGLVFHQGNLVATGVIGSFLASVIVVPIVDRGFPKSIICVESKLPDPPVLLRGAVALFWALCAALIVTVLLYLALGRL